MYENGRGGIYVHADTCRYYTIRGSKPLWGGMGVVESSMGMRPGDVFAYLGYMCTMIREVMHASTAVNDVRIIISR